MKEQRVERVAELIKREVSIILLSRVRDPRLKAIYHHSSEKYLKTYGKPRYLFIFPKGIKKKNTRHCKKATGFIKSELALRLRIKFMPEIVFVIDDTMEKSFSGGRTS